MSVGQVVQGVWLGVWLVMMLVAWIQIRRVMGHVEKVDAGVEDREPGATALIGRARLWALVALGWAMLHAVVGVLTR